MQICDHPALVKNFVSQELLANITIKNPNENLLQSLQNNTSTIIDAKPQNQKENIIQVKKKIKTK